MDVLTAGPVIGPDRETVLAFLDQGATTTTDERDAGITDHVLWPNPSSGIVRLTTGNTGANARIEVRDALGQVVRTYQASALGSGPWTLDLSGLARGLYPVSYTHLTLPTSDQG